MKFIFLLTGLLLLSACSRPPEQVYHHPKLGNKDLMANVSECDRLAERFGLINMSPAHQYPMEDMKDSAQHTRIFRFCMMKKGYEM